MLWAIILYLIYDKTLQKIDWQIYYKYIAKMNI